MSNKNTDKTTLKTSKFDYSWEYDCGEEVSHDTGKYRNDLKEIYNNKPEGSEGLVIDKDKDFLLFNFL